MTTESPTFGGYSWPGVGQYEKIVGKAFGEVDPGDPKNALIADIALAPRNADGNVEYSFDFYILKPIDLSQGAHKVMYEPPNRGGKTWANFGRVTGGNDPGSITDPAVLANAFLMPRGYTLVWSGGRTERNRQEHLYAEGVFPFANVRTTDPITGATDSRYARCTATGTCPLAVEIYSANEYWVKAASLLHTDPTGTADLHDSRFTRNYFISSHQHGIGNPTSRGVCQQLLNPLNSGPVQRAPFIALDEWADGRRPPHSRVPKLSDGTLVPPLPQSGMGFPSIPGVTYTGLKTTRYLLDDGPDYYTTGIPSVNPPLITLPYEDNPLNGPIYPSFVPKTDHDGNDIVGVRLPDVTVPLATYTGWALRAGPQANDGCESNGQYIPFAKTEAGRLASGDPRRSIEERYDSLADYYEQATHAIDNLVKDRLMLCEDAVTEQARLLKAGIDAGLPSSDGKAPSQALKHCR